MNELLGVLVICGLLLLNGVLLGLFLLKMRGG